MNSKGKNFTQTVAKSFAPAVRGETQFIPGSVLNCDKFFMDYDWEFNPPFNEDPVKNKTLIEFSELLNKDKSGAFTAKPENFGDMYVIVRRNNAGKIIAGAAFFMLHIDTVCVCYIEAIIVHEDYKHMGIGSQIISVLKECLRSIMGKVKDHIQYLYLFAEVSRVANPHGFFQKQGAKAGFPADFASWKNQELDQVYYLVEPFSAIDTQNIARNPLQEVDIPKTNADIAKGAKGKSKNQVKTAVGKAKSAINLEVKSLQVTAKAARSANQRGAQIKDTFQIKESALNKSETESILSKMTSKTASGAFNKHCMQQRCQAKLISGYNWSKHLTKVHEGTAFICNKDYYLCNGDDCHLCKDSANKFNRHGVHKKKQCKQCGELKRQDKFSKEDKEVCLVCAKGISSGSKVNNAEKQQQPKLTQEFLEMLDDQHMDEAYEVQRHQQNCDDKLMQVNNNLKIITLESISQVGQKRTFSQTEGDRSNDSLNRPTKRQETETGNSLLHSFASQAIVVAHTDLDVVQQLRYLESNSENYFVGTQTIQKLCNVFSQDVVVLYFMEPQAQFIADCIISSMKRCENLSDMQVSGLVTASFFIKGQCWPQAIKLLNQLTIDRRETTLNNLSLVLAKHFDSFISKQVCQFYRYVGQQQLEIIMFLKQIKEITFTAEILMLSLTVDAQNIPLFVKSVQLFVQTAAIKNLLLDTIAERPVQIKMSYEAFTILAALIQEKDYSASIKVISDQLKESNIIDWAEMIKQQQESAHILDEDSVQKFLDELILTYKDTKLDKDLQTINDNLAIFMSGQLFGKTPNKRQFAVAQYCIGKLYSVPRQLWVVPSGQGKSRIAAATALIPLICNMFSIVHLVFENDALLNRDKADFEDIWAIFGVENRVQYHVSYNFEPLENELIIIDEADALIYRNPVKFREFTSRNACVCFTATPDSKECKLLEDKVLNALHLAKFFYVLDKQAQQDQNLDFNAVIDSSVDKIEYVADLSESGPVIFYGTKEQGDKLRSNAELNTLALCKDTDPQLLRQLDEQQVDGKYPIVIVPDCSWMRGTDFRSQKVKMALVIAQSYENYREAIQGYNRVGRFGDDCQRIIFADVKLVDVIKEANYKKTLMEFSMAMSKPFMLKPITINQITKLKPDKGRAAKAKLATTITANFAPDDVKRTPAFGQTRANQLLQLGQLNFKTAEQQPIINNIIMEQKQ